MKNLFIYSFVFLSIFSLKSYGQETADAVFLNHSRAVLFDVNKSTISKQDKHRIKEELLNQFEKWDKNGIILGRSAASPEGPSGNNLRLAKKRKETVVRFLKKCGINTSNIRFDVVVEDYDLLVVMMEERQDDDCQIVKDIISKSKKNRKRIKSALKAREKGRLWKRLLKEYFPLLRGVRIMGFDLKKVQPMKQDAIHPLYIPISIPRMKIKRQSIPLIKERCPLLSIKTNLLEYALYTPKYGGYCPAPNISIEYYPVRGKFTFGASVDFPWYHGDKNTHKHFEIRNWQLFGRYYFKGNQFQQGEKGAMYRGWYLSAYIHTFLFEICSSATDGKIGEGIGGGLGIGYALPLCKNGRWKMDFGLQVGAFITKYDPFIYGNPVNGVTDGKYYYNYVGDVGLFKKRQYSFFYIGPTRLEVTLSYDLLYRKSPKGISFKSKEGGRKR